MANKVKRTRKIDASLKSEYKNKVLTLKKDRDNLYFYKSWHEKQLEEKEAAANGFVCIICEKTEPYDLKSGLVKTDTHICYHCRVGLKDLLKKNNNGN